MAVLTSGRESSVTNDATSPAPPPPPPLRNPRSDGMIGSLRIVILIFVATANTMTNAPNNAVPTQNLFTKVTRSR